MFLRRAVVDALPSSKPHILQQLRFAVGAGSDGVRSLDGLKSVCDN